MASRTALVTGASGGIGHELARVLGRNGHDLVIVARNDTSLNTVAHEIESASGVSVTVLARDLARPSAAEEIAGELERRSISVDVLVNNAGFATYGLFAESDRIRELEMIQVNVVALTDLTRLLVAGMVQRGRGRILNVASTAAFQPGPLMAVYYATKAYALSFSEALANELRGTGVTVTALCPGPTRSGFQQRAAMEDTRLVQFGLMDAGAVARAGYAGMMKGKVLVIPGVRNALGAFGVRLAPRGLVAHAVRRMHERVKAD